MDINKLFDKNEQPLDTLIPDGGFCGIFRTIGVIGDSLSSGEFEVMTKEGIKGYHDFYEYSWGQYIARATGSKVYNFSRGGMTAKEFADSFGDRCGVWDYDKQCQCYIIALGVNDKNIHEKVGTADDVGFPTGYKIDTETLAAYYGSIIIRLKSKVPEAKFFLVSAPRETEDDAYEKWKADEAKLLYELSERFENTYVIDLNKYAPVYGKEFKEKFFLLGHLNPTGYLLTAKMIMTYMDYIIRHNIRDFKQTALIGTQYKCEE